MALKLERSTERSKHVGLLGQYREKIFRGIWPAGKRIPSCRQLAAQAGVGRMTVQRVLGELQDEGFVSVIQAKGTVVSEYPPHLCRYGVVFPDDPWGRELEFWPQTLEVIDNLLHHVQEVDPRRTLVPFYDITGHTDVEDYRRLKAEIAARRFAGLFYVMPRSALRDSDLILGTNLPTVSLLGGSNDVHQITDFEPNSSAAYTRGLDWLMEHKCHRIAVLDATDLRGAAEAKVEALFKARGLEYRPHWVQQVNIATPHTVEKLVRLLLSGSKKERPDGILAANPTIVEHVTLGVKASGLSVPNDLVIVGGHLFPDQVNCHVPVCRLGSDMRELLCGAIETIDRYRRGEKVPSTREIPVIRETELPASDPLLRLAQAEIVRTVRA